MISAWAAPASQPRLRAPANQSVFSWLSTCACRQAQLRSMTAWRAEKYDQRLMDWRLGAPRFSLLAAGTCRPEHVQLGDHLSGFDKFCLQAVLTDSLRRGQWLCGRHIRVISRICCVAMRWNAQQGCSQRVQVASHHLSQQQLRVLAVAARLSHPQWAVSRPLPAAQTPGATWSWTATSTGTSPASPT